MSSREEEDYQRRRRETQRLEDEKYVRRIWKKRESSNDGGWFTIIAAIVGLAIVWFLFRLMLRLAIDAVYFVLTPALNNYVFLFVLAVGLLFFGILGLLTGKGPKIRILPLLGSGVVCAFGFWGASHTSTVRMLPGSYVRKDGKAKLLFEGDSILISSGKNRLAGRCQFRPCLSGSVVEARIDGWPEAPESEGAFSTSVDGMFGETIYKFWPTEDSLLIFHADTPVIRYVRQKQ